MLDHFQSYREQFPAWKRTQASAILRTSGPLTQTIAFETLRSGAYRPSCSVRVAGPPGGARLLFHTVADPLTSLHLHEHAEKWQIVLRAMEKQFQPNVRLPLDVLEVTRLAEVEAKRNQIINVNHASVMATLIAYLGDAERALH